MSKPPPMKTPPPTGGPAKPPGMPTMPKAPPTPLAPVRAPREFTIISWSGENEGEKITEYGPSGIGKTSHSAMSPSPVFIGLDDGARKIRDPRTGNILKAVSGIRDFADVRDVLTQPKLFHGYKTVVLDTITKAEELSEAYMFDNYKTDKGQTVKTIEGYGWGKGYRHSLEVMRLLLQDCEILIRAGYNVILLAQETSAKMANAEGLDWLELGPKLHHDHKFSNRLELCEWSDHVLRIGYSDIKVAAESATATKGKIVSRDTTRVIYTKSSRHFFAKSRTLTEPVISFENAADDSLWRFMFPEEYP